MFAFIKVICLQKRLFVRSLIEVLTFFIGGNILLDMMNTVVFDTKRKGLEQIKISKSATNDPFLRNFIIEVARLVARTIP